MDKESAEFIVNTFQFLKGKRVNHAGRQVEIADIGVENKGEEWKPVAKITQGGETQESILLDHHLRSEISVMLAEVDSLQYNELGCARLHELMQEIYKEIPIKPENYRVLNELKPFLGYWAPWDNKETGETEFEKVKKILCSDLQSLS